MTIIMTVGKFLKGKLINHCMCVCGVGGEGRERGHNMKYFTIIVMFYVGTMYRSVHTPYHKFLDMLLVIIMYGYFISAVNPWSITKK